MSAHSTEELLNILNSIETTEELGALTEQTEPPAFSGFADFYHSRLEASGLSESEVIRRSRLSRTYAYQILSGRKSPGRDKVLCLCLALNFPLADVQRALTLSGLDILYPRRKWDAILIYAVNQALSVPEANELLFEMGEEMLK